MEYKEFEKVIFCLKNQSDKESKAYDLKIDLFDFVDPYHLLIQILLIDIYGVDGFGWFSWFCYENDFGDGKPDATEEINGEKKPICYNIPSLHEYLETNYKKQ